MGNELPSETQAKGGSASFGKYQLFASLGRGGMADVFLAVARGPMGFNKLTVIKRLRSDHLGDPSFLNMLLDEARLAARLSHPNVVHTYEVGENKGAYFIAMEYLEGQPLNKIVKATQKSSDALDPAFCARIISDALSGLHHAHELRDYDGTPLKIIHRDVSPHNIFVTYDGQVKLMDFGIAKAASSSTQTEAGVLKGKIAYMAPEQASGGAMDRRADIFAMGIVLWELLSRQRLFSSTSAAATLHKLMSGDVKRLSSVVPGIDPMLDEIAAKALARAPDDRYQTAAEMRDALEAFVAKGKRVRQEDIGTQISELFEETRSHVHRQIQAHMGAVSAATNTSELMALNLESMKRFDALQTPSGRGLLDLGGVESGSGSGVVSASKPNDVRQSVSRVTAPKKNGTRRAAIGLGVLVLGGVALLGLRCGKQGDAPASTTASAESAPVASVAPPHVIVETIPASAAPVVAPVPSPTPTPAASVAAESATATPIATPIATTGAPVKNAPANAAPPPKPSPVAVVATAAPPAAAAPPATAAPSAAVAAASDEGTGYVTLDTYPWTRVSEGGHVLGITPLVRQPLSAGPHTLTLENVEQGITQTYPVNVKAGETVSRRLGLK